MTHSTNDDLEINHLKMANEINKNALLTIKNRLKLIESTKSWKFMCALRRVNEQFLKGDKIEKKKFIKWFTSKIFNRSISEEYSLNKFSPIQHEKIEICEIQFKTTNSEETLVTFTELKGEYIQFNKTKTYDIFRFPVINWDFRWQRPQQIASQFADHGHRVFYLSVDITPLKSKGLDYQEVSKHVLVEEVNNNIWIVKLCSNNKINVYQDSLTDQNDLLYMAWSLEYVKERFNIGYSVSIIDLPFWSKLTSKMTDSLFIYDCMDDHTGFSTNSSNMLSDEKTLITSVDLVLASSKILYEKIKIHSDKAFLLRNAGDFELFSKSPTCSSVQDEDKVTIGYYGAISEWFDIELICYLANRNPEWNFILIGDTFGCDITKAQGINNIKFLGEKPYNELPSYLKHFDVAIIPFYKNELTLATNPVKVYEYLAAGKPVVSVDLPELNMMSDVVYLASTREEFEKSITKALKFKDDKNTIDKRKRFAADNSWSSRYESLASEIKRKFFPKVSIVIVTYNNWSYTKQCLNSLIYTNDYPDLEIIVVDNMSTDETRIELSRILHPQLKVILSPINTGFAGGNSIGCQSATGDYIILLNNDTILSPGWVYRLIKPLIENEEYGMAGPVSNSVGNDQMLDFFVGDPIHGADKLWLNEFYKVYKGQYYETELLGFYCVAIKREVYDLVGDLDISYGIGMFEDDDYCERVKEQGYKLIVVRDAFVYHHGSASFKKIESSTYQQVWERNKALFEKKWGRSWSFPKSPGNSFIECHDKFSVSSILQAIKSRKVMILGQKVWNSRYSNKDWEQLVINSANTNSLVIVYVHQYNNVPVVGIRKLSEQIYLTNRIDLFSEGTFDEVIYCGETTYQDLKSSKKYICSDLYDDKNVVQRLKTANSLEELPSFSLSLVK